MLSILLVGTNSETVSQIGVRSDRQNEVRPVCERGSFEAEQNRRFFGKPPVPDCPVLAVHHQKVPVWRVGVLGGKRSRHDGSSLYVEDEASSGAAVFVSIQTCGEDV